MVKTIDSIWLKNEVLDIQRWENEGGQTIENDAPILDRLLVPPVPISIRSYDRSQQWSERFVIEPFLPKNGILYIRKNMQRTLIMARKIQRKGNPNG